MEMKMPAIAITAVVVITVLAGVLMPVLNDVTDTDNTFTNEGLWRMAPLESGDDYTYVEPNWTYDETALTSVYRTGSNALLGESWCVRANGQYRSASGSGNLVNVAFATTDTITITGSGINGANVQNLPGFGARDNGSYLMTAYDKPVYVLADSPIYATGVSSVDGVSMIIHIEGNMEDGLTITAYSQFNANSNPYPNTISDVVFSNVSVNAESVNGYKDLYILNGITADMTFTNTTSDSVVSEKSGSVSYSSYVVPYEVTAEKAVHFTDNQNAIFAAIPILVIVALLIAVVAMVFRSRQF